MHPAREREFGRPHDRPAKRPINIQDSFLFGHLKERRVLAFFLVSGRALKGPLKRFDRYAVVVEHQGVEILVYKHAIETISEPPVAAPKPARASDARPKQWPAGR